MDGNNFKSNIGGEKKVILDHVNHRAPTGNSPYVRAKHLQLVQKDHDAAIIWFWKAIVSNDRVDSALKDMAVVMKQNNRSEEAIEAIKSFRHKCSKQAQEPLDNLLIHLYKKCNLINEQIELIKKKLKAIYLGNAFNGKTTKTARSHGKKFQVSIKQETARILGNLGWAYMKTNNYDAAESAYRNAQEIEPDGNKACNLGLCLVRKGNYDEAWRVLDDVVNRKFSGLEMDESDKIVNRAEEMMREMEDLMKNNWVPFRHKRLPIFVEISSNRDHFTC